MRIIITGSQGQVGQQLQAHARDRHSVTALPRSSLDITCQSSVNNLPEADMIINAAAYTAVDKAETEHKQAFSVNKDGPAHLARLCEKRQIPLIHISTDYVFDGSATSPYSEDHPINPQNAYGESKAAGEVAVEEMCSRHIIVRTSWIFSRTGSNFLKSIRRLAEEKDHLNIVSDQQGGPTAAHSVAETILTIAEQAVSKNAPDSMWGRYHYSGAPVTNWYEFARQIISQSSDSIASPATLNPISTKEYPTPAARPLYSALDCSKINRAFNIKQPSWQSDLKHVLNSMMSMEVVS